MHACMYVQNCKWEGKYQGRERSSPGNRVLGTPFAHIEIVQCFRQCCCPYYRQKQLYEAGGQIFDSDFTKVLTCRARGAHELRSSKRTDPQFSDRDRLDVPVSTFFVPVHAQGRSAWDTP